MSYYPKSQYSLDKLAKSKRKFKKYDAVLINKITNKIITIPFGDSRYEQYKDTTGLNLYSNKDHGDKKRREAYRARHAKDVREGYYSAGYFALRYLW
jgi:hypothetical protein